jgi:hypothetical protein
MMKIFNLALVFVLILPNILAQETVLEKNSSYSSCFPQVKEGENFGLVFRGPGFNYSMSWSGTNKKRILTQESEIGVGILFSRKIPSLEFYLKPIDLHYLIKLPVEGTNLYVGPVLKFEYNYSLYPQLQSGFDYWFTNFSLGAGARYDFNYKKSSFTLNLSSSIAGFFSRQNEKRDPYFFDLGIDYACKHLNQDFAFGSLDIYNSTYVELLWKPDAKSGFKIGGFIKYTKFSGTPEITIVTPGIKLIINKRQTIK